MASMYFLHATDKTETRWQIIVAAVSCRFQHRGQPDNTSYRFYTKKDKHMLVLFIYLTKLSWNCVYFVTSFNGTAI